MLEELKYALLEWCLDDEQTVSVYLNTISEWRSDSQKLQQQKQRADQLENLWGELKEKLLRYENIPQRIQSFETVLALMNEMERIEMEDNNDI